MESAVTRLLTGQSGFRFPTNEMLLSPPKFSHLLRDPLRSSYLERKAARVYNKPLASRTEVKKEWTSDFTSPIRLHDVYLDNVTCSFVDVALWLSSTTTASALAVKLPSMTSPCNLSPAVKQSTIPQYSCHVKYSAWQTFSSALGRGPDSNGM